ncbi:MAG: inositol monophosphatase family protein [Candidatus Peregrinibacteria bacterium]|nr:inositol monophosphatase family protein [Candidatus Peregrinibacteria bacterium]MDZ4245282.1 inositol monophosphatase family protein [Candidatus Gracilibacteria bacterium]
MLNFAKRIALEAGDIVKKYYYSDHLVIENKSEKDLVTEADKACEKFLVEAINKEFMGHGILGEEGFSNDNTKDYTWIIDPIDGTSNFAHRLPIFAISIGLENKNKEIILGIVYNPISGEFFSAEKGKGAYLEIIGANGINMEPKKLQVSKETKLSKSLLATGFHPAFPKMMKRNFKYFEELQMASHTIRRLGAASIDLAYTAAGYFEGYWELKLKPWDMAAGVLLVTEAGGKVSTLDNSDFSIYDPEILATNGLIHEEILTYFKQ